MEEDKYEDDEDEPKENEDKVDEVHLSNIYSKISLFKILVNSITVKKMKCCVHQHGMGFINQHVMQGLIQFGKYFTM